MFSFHSPVKNQIATAKTNEYILTQKENKNTKNDIVDCEQNSDRKAHTAKREPTFFIKNLCSHLFEQGHGPNAEASPNDEPPSTSTSLVPDSNTSKREKK